MTTITVNTILTIECPAFPNHDYIPAKYACNGLNINPEIIIKGLPENAKSMAIVVDDPDASGETFDHWLMWDIPPQERIEENSAPGIQGNNGTGRRGYTGPCPPGGTHHYHFRIYALDAKLNLPESSDKKKLIRAMKDHIIASGELIGLYKK